jgi:hypothetical protein
MAARLVRCQHLAPFSLLESSFHSFSLCGLHETDTITAWSGDNNGLPILTDNFAGSFDHLQEAHWPDLAMFPAIGSGLDVPNIDSHPSWRTQDPVGHQSIVAEMLQAESICPCYPGYQK